MNITQEEMDFTRSVVWQFIKKNNIPAHVDKEDMLSDGYLGLIDAKKKFDPEVMPNFFPYAKIRIRGAVIDGMRSREWLPRAVLKELHNTDDKSSVEVKKTVSMEAPVSEGFVVGDTVADDSDPYKEANDVFYDLINLIADDNDRAFMQFRYVDNMTFGELGEIFGRTESCMSLWHTRIVKELQGKMSDPRVDIR
jgi:RNA polymerase sigma factor for flagellar operon FliA